jgi:hypothetical protein
MSRPPRATIALLPTPQTERDWIGDETVIRCRRFGLDADAEYSAVSTRQTAQDVERVLNDTTHIAEGASVGVCEN